MNYRIIFILIISFILCLVSSGVSVADEPIIGIVGYIDIEADFVTVSGDYAYVIYKNPDTIYNGLAVIDVSNPSKPVLSHYDINGDYYIATGVTIVDNYAYIYGPQHYIEIVEISNPKEPALAVRVNYDGSSDRINDIAVKGNYAYVASNDELDILDITNPKDPVLIGSYKTNHFLKSISISGNYAYIANYDDGLTIVNISNPVNPFLASNTFIRGNAHYVTVEGNYAYVVSSDRALTIVDINNPTSPVIVGKFDMTGNFNDVVIAGNYAYLNAGRSEGIIIVNISNPTSPTPISIYSTILGRSYAFSEFDLFLMAISASRDGNFVLYWEDPYAFSENYLFVILDGETNGLAILCIDESCKDEIASNVIKSSEYLSDKTVFEKIIQFTSNTVFMNKTTTAVSFIALISIVVVVYGYVRKRE